MHMLVVPMLSSVNEVNSSQTFSCSSESECHLVQDALEGDAEKVGVLGT